MGVRASLRRGRRRTLVLFGALALLAAPAAAFGGSPTGSFWRDFWHTEGEIGHVSEAFEAPARPRWFDALDIGAVLSANSAGPSSAEFTLRVRLDAADFLQRRRAEADELARLAREFERERRDRQQLQRLAARCIGAWRAVQVRLIDLVAPSGAAAEHEAGPLAADLPYLRSLRELLALDATGSAEVSAEDADACRLSGVLDTLDLAADHPRLVAAALERSIEIRTRTMLAAPAPPSAHLRAELRPGSTGLGGELRFGLDLPLPVAGSELDLALGGDASGATARLSWHRSGVAAPRPILAGSAAQLPGPEELERELDDALRRRVLEARLLLQAADRQWQEACGTGRTRRSGESVPRGEATGFDRLGSATIACLSFGALDHTHLAAVLVAVDAEIAALQAAFGAIAASGHALATLVAPHRGAVDRLE